MYTELAIKKSFMTVLYNETYDHSKSTTSQSQQRYPRKKALGGGREPRYRETKTAV